MGIYKAIQEEFRDNVNMNPNDQKTHQQISVAYKGLSQLRMYDAMVLSKGNPESPNWEVTLEQNPMPKPPTKAATNWIHRCKCEGRNVVK